MVSEGSSYSGLFINDGDNVNFTQKDELVLNNVGTEFGRKTLTGDFNGDNILMLFC